MPRLLIASTYPLTIQTFLLPYARHFRERGWRVDAVSSGDMTQVADAFDRTHSIEWSRNPFRPGTLFGAPRALRDLVARERYDLVHAHTPVAAFVTRFALRSKRAAGSVKVIYTAHSLPFHRQQGPVQRASFTALEKLAGRWTDYLVVLNSEDEAAARRLRLVPERFLRVMPGIGVDMATYSARISEADLEAKRREIGLRFGDSYLLCVAEFRAVKRHEDLLEAFASFVREPASRGVHLVLAGGGPLLARSQLLAERLGIAERVRFLGFREDVPTLLRGAKALVLASDFEGLPRSVLEAMVARTPVIGTRVRGITDLLGSGLGALVPRRDPAALARAMQDLMASPEAARARAERAARAVRQFALEKVIGLHERLYAEALSTETTPAAALAT